MLKSIGRLPAGINGNKSPAEVAAAKVPSLPGFQD